MLASFSIRLRSRSEQNPYLYECEVHFKKEVISRGCMCPPGMFDEFESKRAWRAIAQPADRALGVMVYLPLYSLVDSAP